MLLVINIGVISGHINYAHAPPNRKKTAGTYTDQLQ